MINNRINFATSIANEVMKNPEAAINFICCVADEVSVTDLIRIQAIFLKSLKEIPTKTNMNN